MNTAFKFKPDVLMQAIKEVEPGQLQTSRPCVYFAMSKIEKIRHLYNMYAQQDVSVAMIQSEMEALNSLLLSV